MLTRKLLFLCCLLIAASLNAQIQRVEPMNWWTGMKSTELQLMVYGTAIGQMTPSINYPGVTIKKVHKSESNRYLFIDLVIAKNTKPGKFDIRFTQNGSVKNSYTYELKQRKPGAATVKGFDASDVIYLITPDRFANGNEANDVVSQMREKTTDRKDDYGRHGGDIRGIIDHLDYIAQMGFTAIWPTPMLENDMQRHSYHGYAITDHYKVDPRFGTLEEYQELADKARQKGLKLIFDGVVNHTGSQYWWMEELPFHDWVNYVDSPLITNHRRTVNQDPYASNADKELMVRGWFVSSMPDLNQQNQFLANYLIQNNIWWIETLGLAGIRQDTYPYSSKKFLEKWTCRIMEEYPSFSIVGEEWTGNPLIAAYWQKGKANNSGYNGCMKSTMDFPMQIALRQALTEAETWDTGLIRLYDALANDFGYASPKDLLIFGDNHDMDRLYTQLNKDPDLMQMALTYLLTVRGIPELYYGTEVLIENSAKPGDHGLIRTDFPGGWKQDAVNGFTGAGLSKDQQRIKSFLKTLLNWRRNNKVISEGNTLHFAPEKGIYVYFRYTKQQTVMVVLNKNATATTVGTGRFAEIIKNTKNAKNILTGETVSLDQLSIDPKSALILELSH